MDEIIETLKNHAHDATIQLMPSDDDSLLMRAKFPTRGSELWDIKLNEIIHLDTGMFFTLGNAVFGGLELLSDSYLESRNFDYGGTEENYKVIKFTDYDDKDHIIAFYGTMKFTKVNV